MNFATNAAIVEAAKGSTVSHGGLSIVRRLL